MSFKIAPPFDVIPTISEGAHASTDKLSLKRLRDIVSGKDTSYSRSQGMAILRTSDFPNKHRDFEAVLENENESPQIRYLAAVNLGKIATPAAIGILVRNSHVRQEQVLTGVLKALGRIGDGSALSAVLEARKYATGLAATQAEFAANLIGRRIGVEVQEHSRPETGRRMEVDRHYARPLRVSLADDADAELCIRSMASQPFGIEFAETPMYQVRCGRNHWMVLLNREFIDAHCVQRLGKQRAILGVAARRSEETRLYSVAYLVLTSPAGDDGAVGIQIHRPNGNLSFSGEARVAGSHADFSIGALSQPGASALQIDGSFEGGRLNIKTAISTTFVQVRKHEPMADPVTKVEAGS